LNGKTSATQHICKSVKSAPIQSLQLNPEVAFSGVKFFGQNSKYGSVEPPNGKCVAELILCDVFYIALLSRFLFSVLGVPCGPGSRERSRYAAPPIGFDP